MIRTRSRISVRAGFAGIPTLLSLANRDLFFHAFQVVAAHGLRPRADD